MMSLLRLASAALALVCGATWLSGCPQPAPDGADLFRVAVNGAPGGALLSVWGPSDHPGTLYLAGGFVGVEPARLAGTGMSVGRLVESTPGVFTTRCRTDAVLWWVHGVAGASNAPREVWAGGENGTVLRYRDGRCETLPLDLTFPEGAPTFWGLWAQAPDDVYLVGGSAQPTGPKGVFVHWDGTRFSRVDAVPARARGENLYKITRVGERYLVVGAGNVAFTTNGLGEAREVVTGVTASDNRIFTAYCRNVLCLAVGGAASGFVLRSTNSGVDFRVEDAVGNGGLPGLNGVYIQDTDNMFAVGTNGFTMHMAQRGFGDVISYAPPPRTQATLHGVGGDTTRVLAVGGELDERTPMQRAVVLVRGDDRDVFTFDGRTYNALGTLRRSLGGSGQ